MTMKCNLPPYEGDETFVFASFRYSDGGKVFPVLESLGRAGYRIWYDDRNEAQRKEWRANRLFRASACVVFLSKNYMESHDNRWEMNFAILNKIPTIVAILEPVPLSVAAECQIKLTEVIGPKPEGTLSVMLQETAILDNCKGEPDKSILVQDWSSWSVESEEVQNHREEILSQWFLLDEARERMGNESAMQNSGNGSRTRATQILPKKQFFLIREKTGVRADIYSENYLIGASEEADFIITDNPYIGGIHASLLAFHRAGRAIIIDEHSKNGTFVNDIFLKPGERHELHDGDTIQLADETFSFHIH